MITDDFVRMRRLAMWLTCSECGIIKNGIHDMEVHMKTEHVNWLPFKCSTCGCQRATSSQMREHLHSSHRINNSHFIFEDNSNACNQLRNMMDETIRSSLIPKISRQNDENNEGITSPSGEMKSQMETNVQPILTPTSSNSSTPDVDLTLNRKRLRTMDSTDTTSSSSYNAGATILASVTTKDEKEEGMRKKVKEEYLDDEEDKNEENEHANPLAAYLSGLGVLNGMEMMEGDTEGVEQMKEVKIKRTRSSIIKYCMKCNKGIKSNEKGAHVSYHLSKDYNMNRFKCNIGDCKHESYRKVNIVNHQLKAHGLHTADNSLINDRQHEMAQLYQAQLADLFGTNDGEDTAGEVNVLASKE